MARFDLVQTPLAGLVVVQRKPMEDHRGFLSRLYCQQELQAAGMRGSIAQINHTLTREKGSVRGMHFQNPPHAETKLVSCLQGEVWDVAVDLRRGSPTFLQWHAEVLSATNQRSLCIPAGFAHGFQSLTENCELLYLHTVAYHPESEGALNAADPRLRITWPLPMGDRSTRDRNQAFIDAHFQGIANA